MFKITASVLLASIAISTSSAFAYLGGDQTQTTISCDLAQPTMDYRLHLSVNEGGLAGTQIQLTRSQVFTGNGPRVEPYIENYIVRRVDSSKAPVGSPVQFKGKGILFAINYTTSPTYGGKRLATLTLSRNGQMSSEHLVCKTFRRK